MAYQYQDWMDRRIEAAVSGDNPTVMMRMKSGFAVFGDYQFLPGYCVLLGFPQADSLNALPLEQRAQYLQDMTLIGDAVMEACSPLRMNYSILMNLDHYLHAHIEARYDWEPEEFKRGPSWKYPKEFRYEEKNYFSTPENLALKFKIEDCLKKRLAEIGYSSFCQPKEE